MLNDYPHWLLKKWEKNYRELNIIVNKKDKIKKLFIGVLYEESKFYREREFFRKFNIGISSQINFQVKNLTFISRQTQQAIEKHNVVYKVECTCKDRHYYIGETKRQLRIRIEEQKDI